MKIHTNLYSKCAYDIIRKIEIYYANKKAAMSQDQIDNWIGSIERNDDGEVIFNVSDFDFDKLCSSFIGFNSLEEFKTALLEYVWKLQELDEFEISLNHFYKIDAIEKFNNYIPIVPDDGISYCAISLPEVAYLWYFLNESLEENRHKFTKGFLESFEGSP